MSESGCLVGLLEAHRHPVQLGSLLTLLAELSVLRKVFRAATVELQVRVRGEERAASLADIVVPHVPDIDAFRRVSAFETAEATWLWPNPQAKHDLQSSITLQRLYRSYHVTPEVHLSHELSAWADGWLRAQCGEAWPVVIHLKNNLQVDGDSNANFPEWLSFMTNHLAAPIVFVLIGNEPVDARIVRLKNTIVAADHYLSLEQELALIQRAGAFMGMASGPGNMAIFSRVPYVLFKNPAHHAAAMGRELDSRDHFNFASGAQRFLRQRETAALLTRELNRLLAYARVRI